jgi:hypothetical protein
MSPSAESNEVLRRQLNRASGLVNPRERMKNFEAGAIYLVQVGSSGWAGSLHQSYTAALHDQFETPFFNADIVAIKVYEFSTLCS